MHIWNSNVPIQFPTCPATEHPLDGLNCWFFFTLLRTTKFRELWKLTLPSFDELGIPISSTRKPGHPDSQDTEMIITWSYVLSRNVNDVADIEANEDDVSFTGKHCWIKQALPHPRTNTPRGNSTLSQCLWQSSFRINNIVLEKNYTILFQHV